MPYHPTPQPDHGDSPAGRVSYFATTQWSMVLAVGQAGTADARRALAELCETYWPPLYAYLRRTGCSREEAEDTVQGFFALLLERDDLRDVHPERGRFRSFLLASLKHLLSNERDRARAAKRGGGRKIVSFDVEAGESRFAREPADRRTPESLFDRAWALTVLERVSRRLEAEQAAGGKGDRYAVLASHLPGGATENYAAAADRLGRTENAVKVAVHRLRQRFGELLREEIAQTVSGPEEVDDEVKALFAALRA